MKREKWFPLTWEIGELKQMKKIAKTGSFYGIEGDKIVDETETIENEEASFFLKKCRLPEAQR